MSDNELLEIDSKQAIKEFFLEVKERAKLFPRNSIEHYNPNVAAQILWMLAQGGRISVIAKKCKVSHELVRSLEFNLVFIALFKITSFASACILQ